VRVGAAQAAKSLSTVCASEELRTRTSTSASVLRNYVRPRAASDHAGLTVRSSPACGTRNRLQQAREFEDRRVAAVEVNPLCAAMPVTSSR